MSLDQMLRDQQRDHADLDRAVLAVENKIAGLDKRLRPEALQEETSKLRRAAADTLRNLVVNLNNRAKAARDMARAYSPEAELRHARFHSEDGVNANMQMSLMMRLGKTPTGELIEHLKDAVEAKNLARAEAVRLEFEFRDPELTALGADARAEIRRAFEAELRKLELPNSRAAEQTIGKIASLAAFGQERFTSATTGRSDPAARITAARMAAAA